MFTVDFYTSPEGKEPVAELTLAKVRRKDWLERYGGDQE